jgi:hypothetical protein
MDISRCIWGGLFLSITGVLLLQNSSGRSAQDERGRPQGRLKDDIQTALKEGRREITDCQRKPLPSREGMNWAPREPSAANTTCPKNRL